MVRKGARGVVEFDEAVRPGVYLVQLPSGETVHYTVATPFEESDLERLSRDEVDDLAAELGAVAVESPRAYHDLERERRFGREIWKPLLAAVLVLLFLEPFLVRSFQRRTV